MLLYGTTLLLFINRSLSQVSTSKYQLFSDFTKILQSDRHFSRVLHYKNED